MAAPLSGRPDRVAELSVATFNTHWGFTMGIDPYDVVPTCRALDADVLVLQENWEPDERRSLAARVAETLGYELHIVRLARGFQRGRRINIVRHRPGTGWWGVAILTRVGGTLVERIDLGRLHLDAAHRSVLRLDVTVGDATIAVHGTHLSHLTHGSLIQLNRLRQRLPDSSQPAVLLGDMNMWGPVVTTCLPGWRRAVRGRTWPAHRPHSQIDHILVNRAVDVASGEVFPATASDHRPMRAVLRF